MTRRRWSSFGRGHDACAQLRLVEYTAVSVLVGMIKIMKNTSFRRSSLLSTPRREPCEGHDGWCDRAMEFRDDPSGPVHLLGPHKAVGPHPHRFPGLHLSQPVRHPSVPSSRAPRCGQLLPPSKSASSPAQKGLAVAVVVPLTYLPEDTHKSEHACLLPRHECPPFNHGLLADHGKLLTFSCFLSCGGLEFKARVSLNRIEEFLGRQDIEGQPAGTAMAGGGDSADRPRAPVGGLLVQNGTFAWPQTVRALADQSRLPDVATAVSICTSARKLRGCVGLRRKGLVAICCHSGVLMT